MAWRLQQGTHDHTALSTEHLKDFHEYQETPDPFPSLCTVLNKINIPVSYGRIRMDQSYWMK